MHRQFKQ